MSANLLGRETGYPVQGFGAGSRKTIEVFSPAATYAERIDGLFADVAGMGFRGIDLWTSHCHPDWATEEHIAGLRAASARHGVEVVSLAGSLRDDLKQIDKACRLAQAIGCPVLGLGCAALPDRAAEVEDILARHGVKLGLENHPHETTPEIVLEKIGSHPHLGSAFDTGWWGTHGYPVLEALEKLRDRLFLVHLKNIQAPGEHVAARWDEGCMDLKPFVQQLRRNGYAGWISLEYEPCDHDPSEDCRAFLKTIHQWWEEKP